MPVSNLVMNSWFMTQEFIHKLKLLLGLKINLKDLNGLKLIIPFYFMDGVKKKLMEKLLNIGCFKTLGVMIGVKLLMDKETVGSECREEKILMELKVLPKPLIPSLLKLLKEMNNTKNYNSISIQKMDLSLIRSLMNDD